MTTPKLTPAKAHAWTIVIKNVTLLGIFVATFLLFSIQHQNREIAQQAAALGSQNKAIALENQKHIDCIADLFARYSRDKLAITINDLSQCKASYQTAMQILNHGNEPSSTVPALTTQNINTTTKNATSQGDKTQTPAPEQSPAKILGIPICVPLTNVCARE